MRLRLTHLENNGEGEEGEQPGQEERQLAQQQAPCPARPLELHHRLRLLGWRVAVAVWHKIALPCCTSQPACWHSAQTATAAQRAPFAAYLHSWEPKDRQPHRA